MADAAPEHAPILEVAAVAHSSNSPTFFNNYRESTDEEEPSHGLNGSYTLAKQTPSQPVGNGQRPSDRPMCGYCSKLNHTETECRTKQRHERATKEMADMKKNLKKESGAVGIDSAEDAMPLLGQDYRLSSSVRFATRSTS